MQALCIRVRFDTLALFRRAALIAVGVSISSPSSLVAAQAGSCLDHPACIESYTCADASPLDDLVYFDLAVVFAERAQDPAGYLEDLRRGRWTVGNVNRLFANSEVNARVRLAYAGAYRAQTCSGFVPLQDLSGKPTIGPVRDAFGADFVGDFDGGIQGSLGNFDGVADDEEAYFQYPRSSAQVLGEELGHTLGLCHNQLAGDCSGFRDVPYAGGFGGSVMNGGQLPYFSNPRILYQGSPLGDCGTADAVRSINEIRHCAAQFRCGQTGDSKYVPPPTEVVSENDVQALGNGDSDRALVSGTGRYAVFTSRADNLVAQDLNGRQDVFVRNLWTGEVVRVSVSAGGAEGDGDSTAPALSHDGRFVAFASDAANLVGDDANGSRDVFVHDRDRDGDGVFDETHAGARHTFMVSRASDGTPTSGGASDEPSISDDGRFVAFASDAADLVAGDTNGTRDVFVHDLDADEDGVFGQPDGLMTTRVSRKAGGNEVTGSSDAPSLSGDGRHVAFQYDRGSSSLNKSKLVFSPATSLNRWHVYAVDRDPNQDGWYGPDFGVSLLSYDEFGITKVEGSADSRNASISADGRFVAFESDAPEFDSMDANGATDVIWRDRDLDGNGVYDELPQPPSGSLKRTATQRASHAEARNRTDSDGPSTSPRISADGEWVLFESDATNLVWKDENLAQDVFLYDAYADYSARVSIDGSEGEADGPSFAGGLSRDGRVLAFSSDATNLIPADPNAKRDVFSRRVGNAADFEELYVTVAGAGGVVGSATDLRYPDNVEVAIPSTWSAGSHRVEAVARLGARQPGSSVSSLRFVLEGTFDPSGQLTGPVMSNVFLYDWTADEYVLRAADLLSDTDVLAIPCLLTFDGENVQTFELSGAAASSHVHPTTGEVRALVSFEIAAPEGAGQFQASWDWIGVQVD